jgi:AraC-like DNA-binding protein
MFERQASSGVVYMEHLPSRAGLPLVSLWSFESGTADTSRMAMTVNSDGTQSYWLPPYDPLLNTLLPSTHVSLVVNAGDQWAAGRSLIDAARIPHACVIGPMTRARVLRVGARVRAFGAVIPAATAVSVFGAPASVLVDSIVPLADLWSRADVGRLRECASVSTVRDTIMNRCGSPGTNIVDGAARTITRCGGRLSIDALACRYGVSRRTLTRKFVCELGLPPKLYARIARFDQLVFALLSNDVSRWVAVSGDIGFYDQAHMVNEFRCFTGLPPTRFFQPHGALAPQIFGQVRGRPSEWVRQP